MAAGAQGVLQGQKAVGACSGQCGGEDEILCQGTALVDINRSFLAVQDNCLLACHREDSPLSFSCGYFSIFAKYRQAVAFV
jgi:hypothetical protein